MRSSYGLYTLWMHATLYLLVWSLRYSNVLLPVTANTGDSYAGVLLNYTALYKREMKDWYLISWDSKRQIPLRHRFNPEDRDLHPYPKHYCLAPLSGQPDFLVDAIEPGPDVPTFGVPSKYTLQEYRVLQNMTTDAGIVRGMLKVGFSLQNMAMMDMWGSTLFTWRLRDDRRQDKVMYAFGKRDPSLPPNEQWGMDHMGNPDWIEMRMVDNLAANWPLLGEDMRLFKSPTTGKLWASWCSNYRVHRFYYGELRLPPGKEGQDYKAGAKTSLYVDFPAKYITSKHENTPRWEKNWVMFEYNSTLLFIPTIHPLRVVTVVEPPGKAQSQLNRTADGEMSARTVSLSASHNYCWSWGELRGGTPALRVGDEYLAFFHSVTHMNSHIVRTYFLGAYTFSAKPPFVMTGMSIRPIVLPFPKDFVYPDLDYVPYPMSFTFDENDVNVTIGWSEAEGWIVRMDREKLFASLRTMDPVVLGELADDDWSDGPQWESFEYTQPEQDKADFSGKKICERLSYPGNHNCAVL